MATSYGKEATVYRRGRDCSQDVLVEHSLSRRLLLSTRYSLWTKVRDPANGGDALTNEHSDIPVISERSASSADDGKHDCRKQ